MASEVEKGSVRVSNFHVKFIIPFGIYYRNDSNIRHVAEIILTISIKKMPNEFKFILDKKIKGSSKVSLYFGTRKKYKAAKKNQENYKMLASSISKLHK